MNTRRVDYDQLAEKFDHRYHPGQVSDTGKALLELVAEANAQQILEVGCGTGHWLELLHRADRFQVGVDYSRGMLTQAQAKGVPAQLVQGAARQLPLRSGEMDLIYCLNALHHFTSPENFIDEAKRVLRPGGILSIIGSDFPTSREDWYIYKYFNGVYEADLEHFPPWEKIAYWLEKAGFIKHELVEVENIREHKKGADVLLDPFLQKHACSQLALLSEQDYQEGLRKIESDLRLADENSQEIIFKSEIAIMILSCSKAH